LNGGSGAETIFAEGEFPMFDRQFMRIGLLLSEREGDS
jgi:hypothetical protein